MSVTMRQMLEAGDHFGHQTRFWNPKMAPFIFGHRNKIHIVNLEKSLPMFQDAQKFVRQLASNKGTVLFVGTKRAARDIVREEAVRAGMPYVDNRWLGGMLTNFQTIKFSVDRLKKIESMQQDGSILRFPKKEVLQMEKERIKLDRNIGGIKNMRSLPDVIFIIDPKKEDIAVGEATKLGIPVVALTDTNCDPAGIDYLIPGNDDAIRAIKLITSMMAEAVVEGRARRGEEAEPQVEELESAMTTQVDEDLAAKMDEEYHDY